MIIPKLSVIFGYKSGRLTELLEAPGKENIRVTAVSIPDTSDSGILRLIVNDPEKAKILFMGQMKTS